jgi:excisionase family DNA binding protein
MEEHEIVRLAARVAVEQYKIEIGKLFTIEEAAAQLNFSRSTIYNKINSGELEVTDVWGERRFSMDAINRCKKKKSW